MRIEKCTLMDGGSYFVFEQEFVGQEEFGL